MNAMLLDSYGGELRLAEVANPEPVPTEVLVRVKAAGVNPVDYKTAAGSGMARVLGEPPVIVGWDVSGVVEAVGYGVTRFSVGDEVFGMPRFPREAGAYAEFVTVPSLQLARKPARLSHTEAAALPLASLTAFQSLRAAGVGAGTRVLVHAAAGGVGHLAVQIAVAQGASVVGTASAAKHDFVRSLGAEPWDYHDGTYPGEVDVVLDLVGGSPEGNLAPGGVFVSVPSAHDGQLNFIVEPDGAALEEIAALVDAGRLRVEIAAELPLAEAARAHALLRSGRTQGKVVLTVG